ncbi:hypothetical protein CMQ_527 [Grosmannia clavigera kw1407]|uniref:HNH nuclease domain-containing protein n=1 Tax=Grosmannia clavigera (strain kw1407 / UAMH 11150) TaxID=655863 RepID=F0XCU7_GROCL|nr:uncharacterized protein CMQ_527 [Grosmannia clavigera kw1407]EFX03599.1 hypothetical protein CMQ_527 [Grosmannia clavigera kw1407]
MPFLITEEQKVDYRRQVEEFLNSASTTPLAFRTGHDFHHNIDIVDPSDNYARDVERRIGLARRVRQKIRTSLGGLESYNLNIMQLSYFLATEDTHALQRMVEDSDALGWYNLLKHVEPFLSTCCGKHQYLDRTPVQGDGSPSGTAPCTSQDERRRQAGEAAIVAHIIPHTINKNETHFKNARTALFQFLYTAAPALYAEVRDLLIQHDPVTGNPVLSCSDKPFNMVSLNHQLHWYWDRAYFGLKPVSETFPRFEGEIELIKVEWRWLPKHLSQALVDSDHILPKSKAPSQRPFRSVNLDSKGLSDFIGKALGEISGNVEEISPPSIPHGNGSGIPLGHLPSGRRIESGFRFDLRAAKDDAPKMRALLKLQWLAVRMACISGAADFAADLRDTPPDDDKQIQSLLEAQSQKECSSLLQSIRDPEYYHQDVEDSDPEPPRDDEKKGP